jgi:hypothetical protein
MKRATKAVVPVPVKRESRICFGIAWFSTEADAKAYDAYVKEKGYTYNGGFFHGMSCGRDTSFDFIDGAGRQLYAVTD